MGADLILMAVPFPTYSDGEPVKLDDMAARFVIEERVRTAMHNPEVFTEVHEQVTGEIWDEDDEEGNGWTRDAFIQEVVGNVDVIFSGWRDTALFPLDNKWWLFAGGTSWGDSFEGMDALSALSETGALKEPIPR